jgi:hypothetical protein
MDGKEACTYCGTRGAHANFPCPKCLVYQTDLHKIGVEFELCTTERMREVYEQAHRPGLTKSHCEELLKSYGLHDTEVCSL